MSWLEIWNAQKERCRNLEEWEKVIGSETLDLLKKIPNYVEGEFNPNKEDVFVAFKSLKPQSVRVVIIGQDPYPNKSASGLAFSSKDRELTPSLRTILDSLKINNYNWHGDLSNWVDQGVFLINRALTTPSKGNYCHKLSWKPFTTAVLKALLAERSSNIVVMLWGKDATSLKKTIGESAQVKFLCSSHPTTNFGACNKKLASGYPAFIDADHFNKANEYLKEAGLTLVDWQAPWGHFGVN
jgi:uracil-DNA glycosylase